MSDAATRARRVRTDPRISRRRRAVERAGRRRVLVRLLAAGGVALLAWGVFWSPLLHVNDIRVTGARNTPIEEVVASAGVREAQNLLLLSTDAVARRVERLPWVRSVEVTRMLPGTVRIAVVERRPALVLSLGAARWTLDARGRVLAPGEAEPGLPVLAGVGVGTVEPGVRLQTVEAVEALRVLRSLPRRLRAEVAGVFAPTLERITLKLTDGVIVRYGAAEDMGSKNAVLAAVLRRIRADGEVPAVVDVRVPTSPAVSPAADAASI
ncbi:MAG TPA: FtsQ-type POTRA domain-containing protein [Actinomycetota bacterium]|nr:FtsQ-type POTRA domain-containing protein [Actinomycetota bacterium]